MSAIFKEPSTGLLAGGVVLFAMAGFGLFNWYIAWQPLVEFKSASGTFLSAECVEISPSGGNRRGTTLWAQPKLAYQFEYQNSSISCSQWGRNKHAAFPKMAQCSTYISSLANERLLVWFDEKKPTQCVLDKSVPWPLLELAFLGISALLVSFGSISKARPSSDSAGKKSN